LAFSFVVYHDEGPVDKSFVILHTNDSHCHYADEGNVGFETVSALREQYSKDSTVFTVDAGDYLQGTSYGLISLGTSSVEVMNTVGYDVGIPGNHEFDFSFDVFLERVEQANYPIICSNLVYKDTGKSVLDEYLILKKGGVKIGFFGLLTEQMTSDPLLDNAKVTDSYEAAERMVEVLKKEGVDYIVAIGHLGVVREGFTTSDMVCNKVEGIDIFIDGHSHTEMEDGKVCDGSVILEPSETLIASTGSFVKNVGVITSDSEGMTAKLYRGPALQNEATAVAISEVKKRSDERLNTKIGTTEVLLYGGRPEIRTQETNMGDLITDAMLKSTWSDVAIIGGGSIRSSIQAGDITVKKTYEVLPFANTMCTMKVLGSAIWDDMEYSLSLQKLEKGGYLQFSGMTITYDPDAQDNQKILSLKIGGEEIDKNATYKIVTTNYIAEGGDGHIYYMEYPYYVEGDLNMAFIDYISGLGTITESTIQGDRLIAV
jgi:5'-nucleotidase